MEKLTYGSHDANDSQPQAGRNAVKSMKVGAQSGENGVV